MRNRHTTLPISTGPHGNDEVRRATRVLSMVHELHKAGYQGIRVCCGITDRNADWVCHIFSAENTAPKGWAPANVERAIKYTPQGDGTYFGWKDSSKDTARQLAAKLLSHNPEIAREGAIEDWAYAGWLSYILGHAEHGQLPVFYGELDKEKEANRTTILPPSTARRLELEHGDNCVFTFIENEDLELSALPSETADLEEMMNFVGDTYYIYRLGILDYDELEAANCYVQGRGLEGVSMHALRASGYYLNRSLAWADDVYSDPDYLDHKYTQPLRLILAEMRKRLTK